MSRLDWLDRVLGAYFASPAATIPQTTAYFLNMLDALPDCPSDWAMADRPTRFYTVNNRLCFWFVKGRLAKGPVVQNVNKRRSVTWVRADVAVQVVVSR